jgi:hypothetical protein
MRGRPADSSARRRGRFTERATANRPTTATLLRDGQGTPRSKQACSPTRSRYPEAPRDREVAPATYPRSREGFLRARPPLSACHAFAPALRRAPASVATFVLTNESCRAKATLQPPLSLSCPKRGTVVASSVTVPLWGAGARHSECRTPLGAVCSPKTIRAPFGAPNNPQSHACSAGTASAA